MNYNDKKIQHSLNKAYTCRCFGYSLWFDDRRECTVNFDLTSISSIKSTSVLLSTSIRVSCAAALLFKLSLSLFSSCLKL